MKLESPNHKRTLYLGLDPSRYTTQGELVHCPIIETIPYPFEGVVKEVFEKLEVFTHVLFTSRTAVSIYKEYAAHAGHSLDTLNKKVYIAVGKATALKIKQSGFSIGAVAKEESAEGVVSLLKQMQWRQAHLFFPRSVLGRTLIYDYLKQNQIQHTLLDLYKTLSSSFKLPDLEAFDEIVFTSPSTVEAFFKVALSLPKHIKCTAIGPITEASLKCYLPAIAESV